MNFIRSSSGPESRKARRRGLASVVMLVALFVLGLIAIALVKVAFARRAEVARNERLAQADWLADSGVDRALTRLEASVDYPGESWTIAADEFAGRGPAVVAIRVETPPDQPGRRRVRVEADYPAGSILRTRQSRTIMVAVPSPTR
jgi:Tfp pilus assembly protein PilX